MKKKFKFFATTLVLTILSVVHIQTFAFTGISSVNMALTGTAYSNNSASEPLLNDGRVDTSVNLSSSTTGTTKTYNLDLQSSKIIGKISVYMGKELGGSTGYITIDYLVEPSTWVNIGTIDKTVTANKNKWHDFILTTPVNAKTIRVHSAAKSSIIVGEIAAYEYGTRKLEANTFSHTNLSDAQNSNFTGTLTYTNTLTSEPYPLTYLLGLYEDIDGIKTLKEVAIWNEGNLPIGENINVFATLDLSQYSANELENCYVQQFLWEGSINKKPVQPTKIFPTTFNLDVD